jgi:hypothetical protein
MKNKNLLLELVSLLVLLPSLAIADLAALNNSQITEFLTGRKVEGVQNGKTWYQSFPPGGYTEFSEKQGFQPTVGLWRALNDQYCSQWPPSETWDCYIFKTDGENLVFIPAKGGTPWPALGLPK